MTFSSYASDEFWKFYRALPVTVQGQADKQFALFRHDPFHPSLRLKQTGQLWSVRIRLSLSRPEDNGVTTTTEYDDLGRPTLIIEPQKTTDLYYNNAERYRRTSTTLETQPTRRLYAVEHFDQLGRLVLTRRSETGSISDTNRAQGIRVETRYLNTPSGRYEFVTNPHRTPADSGDPPLGWTRRKYDGAGRLREEASLSSGTYPGLSDAGLTGKVTIDYAGRTGTIKDQAANLNPPNSSNPGSVRTITVDSAGRTIEVTDATGLTSYTYDGLNNLKSVQQGSQTARSFNYDPLSRLTSATNPESGTTNYRYDDNGNLIEKNDNRGIKTCYGQIVSGQCNVPVMYQAGTEGYDGLNRPRMRSYNDGTPTVTYTYDSSQSIPDDPPNTHPEVNSQNYPRGRLVRVAAVAPGLIFNTVYRYDSAGRVRSSMQTTGEQNYVFGYTYNAGGLTALNYPSGHIVSYNYDNGGRIDTVRKGDQYSTNYYASAIGYTPHGAVKTMQFGNQAMQQTTFNSRLQPEAISAVRSGINLLGLTLTYAASGNNGDVLTQTITTPARSWQQTFSYDAVNRLKTASEAGGWLQQYVHDRYGNRALLAGTSYYIPGGVLTPQVEADNPQLVEVIFPSNKWNKPGYVVHDPAGNQTQLNAYQLTYDAENRLTFSTINSSTTQYWYDGEGRRVQKQGPNGTTVYVYDAMDRVAAEYSTQSPDPNAAGLRYLTQDHLGSTRLITDANGAVKQRYDYLPFGEELPQGMNGRPAEYPTGAYPDLAHANTLEFTGKELDPETGLQYFGARYFCGRQGRFTTVDPKLTGVPFPEHLANPQRWNMYAYAANNPLKFVDPKGEDVEFAVTFQGNFSDEEKRRILEALRQYLSELDVGKVVVRDSASPDKRTTMQKLADWFKGAPDFAQMTITDEVAGQKHLPDKVYTSDFAKFRDDTNAFATVVADAVLHEALSHQLALGEDPRTQQFDMLGQQERFKNDPYVVHRQGTLYESKRNTAPEQGIRPLYPKDQKAIEERLKPIHRKYEDK